MAAKGKSIVVQGLGKRYSLGRQKRGFWQSFPVADEFWALRDLSFEVASGERIGVIGHNGAGKSTLLKILSRITRPTEGSVWCGGRVANILEVGTGFHPDLSGRENIFMNGAMLGMRRAEIRAKLDEIVAFAEIERFIDVPVKRYSSGMYIRLAFSVAANVDSDILVIDEVLAVGDSQFQKKCMGKMQEVGRSGRTLLFVSHNLGLVTSLCQRSLLLKGGKLVADGPTDQVISRYMAETQLHSAEALIEPEAGKPVPDLRFRRISLLNPDGSGASSFDVRRPFRVQVEYEAARPIQGGEISIRFCNSQGVHVFTLDRSSSIEGPIEKGRYLSEFEIPGHFLVPDGYSLDICAHVPNVDLFEYREGVLSFHVEETGSAMAIYQGRSYGVILLERPWKESRV